MGTLERRAAIEAAMDQSETTTLEEDSEVVTEEGEVKEIKEIKEEPTSTPIVEDPSAPTKKQEPSEPTETAQPSKIYSVDKPPSSWRPAQQAKWAKLEPDVRQEVIRREREVDKTLSDSTQARQVAGALYQTVQPYMARIQSQGIHPIAAIQELLKADHILSTAPKGKRAEFMAKLISDYDIDVAALADALDGKPTTDPTTSAVEKLLQERLQPFMKFIQDQTQGNQQAQQRQQQKMAEDIEVMAADPKYPEFDTIREDMADIIDLQSKKGVYLTLEQAYTRAIAMNPEVSERVRKQTEGAQRQAAAKDKAEKARKALAASVSVNGAPEGSPSGANTVNGRRATIAAAFDQLEGR